MERLIHCRKCGKLMKRELVDGWKAKLVCSCGFSDFQVLYGVTRSMAPVLVKTKSKRVKDSTTDIKLEFEHSILEREKKDCLSAQSSKAVSNPRAPNNYKPLTSLATHESPRSSSASRRMPGQVNIGRYKLARHSADTQSCPGSQRGPHQQVGTCLYKPHRP